MQEPKEINANYILLIIILPFLLLITPSNEIEKMSLFIKQFSTVPSHIGLSLMSIFFLVTTVVYVLKVKSNDKKNIRHYKNVKLNESFIVVFGVLFTLITSLLVSSIILI